MTGTIHRAKYILVDPYTLIQDAAIETTADGYISKIAPWCEVSGNSIPAQMDWGTSIIMPGLVNAHVHLELTRLCNQLTRYDSFTDWLLQLMAQRRAWSGEELHSSIKTGVDLSLASGTTTVGDISSSGITRDATHGSLLRRVIFEESIAFSSDQAESKVADLNRILNSKESCGLFSQGVSPHAPYSVSGELYHRLAKLAQQRKIPLATHIAETEAEIRFLRTGTGEFHDFLQSIGVLPPDWNPPGLPPIPYLHSLGVLNPQCLLVHCNYLDPDSIDLVASSSSNVVYCPRSHAFFGHRKHPIRHLLDAGINVALGTDSLASNKTLSMLDEIRFLSKLRKDLKSEEILQAATLNGAQALNFSNNLGLLKPGYRADMTVLMVPSSMNTRQVADQILEGAGECIGTVVGGRVAWHDPDTFPLAMP